MRVNIRKNITKHSILLIAVIAYMFVLFLNKQMFFNALKLSINFLKEMVEILPPIIILSTLITVWVPKELIIKFLGKTSGIKGKIFSLLVGSVSAGPIYAAFPVTQALLKKGASTSNIVIILSSWAVIKVPMLLVEAKCLGFKFTLIRYLCTIPFIFLMGYIMEKMIPAKNILKDSRVDLKEVKEEHHDILKKLPGYNCKSCGFTSCNDFSKAVTYDNIDITKCKFV